VKGSGKPDDRKGHVRFDVAGAGNGFTVELVRHRQTKETEQIGYTYGTPRQSSTLPFNTFCRCDEAVFWAHSLRIEYALGYCLFMNLSQSRGNIFFPDLSGSADRFGPRGEFVAGRNSRSNSDMPDPAFRHPRFLLL